eukprot:Hpha_TRINITY_DN16404_c4_g3::TRINITY_DN16404_c4_g3_i6::g.161004::m.161004
MEVDNVCKCCIAEFAVRPTDSPADVRIKRTLVPVVISASVLVGFYFLWALASAQYYAYALSCAVYLAASSIFLFRALSSSTRHPLSLYVEIFVVLSVVCFITVDLSASSVLTTPGWPLVIICLDTLLVYDIPRTLPMIVGMTLLYFVSERAESAFRFGVYDAIRNMNNMDVFVCDCASPPCAGGFDSIMGLINNATIFLLDFYFTRAFANGMNTQLRRVNASVEVAAEVAAALARYDIEGAGRSIARGGKDLPKELVNAYTRLLSNLQSYRDYLPDTLLMQSDDGGVTNVPPPATGGGEVEVGMVFTDIQSSTALWEDCPEGMYEALHTHNATLRAVAMQHHGYEVKIIGDALMLAFASAENAVRFGAVAQSRLVHSEWPSELCEHKLCRRVDGPGGLPLWHGLRVRIGINWGPVQAELNPVNGRFDFFGTTVNTASRVEAALRHGGLTGVTKAVLDAVGQHAMGTFFTASLGDRELKGVAQPVPMYV